MIDGIALAVAAALGTTLGLFVGIPIAGFCLWPLVPARYRLHDHPVVQIESSLAAGLGMALGVLGSVGLVGTIIGAPQTWTAATNASAVAGLTFGSLWTFGFRRDSATPLLASTAALAALAAALSS